MTIIRATSLFCATILASVAAMLFCGYQQEQYVISASGQFVSIFDRKHQTINVCDKTDCRLLLPQFAPKIMEPQMSTFSSPVLPANQMPSSGRMPGVFNPAPPVPGMMGNPQMMNQGNAPGMPPMGNPQMMGQGMPQGGMPQGMPQGMLQGGNPQMMRSPIAFNGQMGPGGPMMTNNQFPPRPYMMQPQMMGGMPPAPLPPPPAPPAAPQDDSSGNAQDDNSASDAGSDDTTSTDEAPSEEAAPV